MTSISDELLKQENFCEQYRLILDNKNQIIEQIKTIEEKHQDLYEQYLTLGKLLSFLMFNKRKSLWSCFDCQNRCRDHTCDTKSGQNFWAVVRDRSADAFD